MFGDYIDIYDISRAVGFCDRAIYYESRLARINSARTGPKSTPRSPSHRGRAQTEGRLKRKWASVEGPGRRGETLVADDLVRHFGPG